jgi:hypothetical protein
MLNDCVYTSKSTGLWHWFQQDDIERRAATIAQQMRSYPRAICVCGGTGEYWEIQNPAAYNDTVDKCIRVFQSYGIHALRHMTCWEAIADKRTTDKKHFRAEAQAGWYPHFENLLQLLQTADLTTGLSG